MWRQDFVIAKLARFLLLSLGMLRRLFWLLAALAIPLIGGIGVSGLVQGTKSLSGLAERNQIEWAQKFLPASSAVPTFEETILYSYNDIVSPASDWTWTTYGEPTIKWGESLIRE